MSNDKKLFEQACKLQLLDIVQESKVLHEKLSKSQLIELGVFVKNMKYEDALSLLVCDGCKLTTEQARDAESTTKKIAMYGAGAALGRGVARRMAGVKSFKAGQAPTGKGALAKTGRWLGKTKPGEVLTRSNTKRAGRIGMMSALAGMFLYRKLSDPCFRKHPTDKNARLMCSAEAIKKVMGQIKGQMGQCAEASDPIGCKKKLQGELTKWNQKLQTVMSKSR